MSSNIRLNRICQHCGKEFIAKTTVTKYCGDRCAKLAYKARVRNKKVENSNVETQKIKEQPLLELRSKDILTVKEAAAILSSSIRAVYDMINDGRLKAVNLSKRKTRIRRSEIDKIFEQPDLAVASSVMSLDQESNLTIDNCYPLKELEKKYGISNKALHTFLKRNNVRKLKKGKFVYVPKEEVDELLSSNKN